MLRVFILFLLFFVKLFKSVTQTNSTLNLRNNSSVENFLKKTTDRFVDYPQSDATQTHNNNYPQSLFWSGYTPYNNAVFKYASPYIREANENYASMMLKSKYLSYGTQHSPNFHYALDQKAVVNPCTLPEQVGNGPYRIPKWYYNTLKQKCELFYWSGCCANANNFQTYQECQQQCEGTNVTPANTIVYVPFTLTFVMRPTDSSNNESMDEQQQQAAIRIRPTFAKQQQRIGAGVASNSAEHSIDSTNLTAQLKAFASLIRNQSGLKRKDFEAKSGELQVQALNENIKFPEYQLSTITPSLVGPIVPTKWINNNEDYRPPSNQNSDTNSVVDEILAAVNEPSYQTTKKVSTSAKESQFRRLIPLQQVQVQPLPPPPPQPLAPPVQTASIVFPAPTQTLIPIYPIAPVPSLVSIQPAHQLTPPSQPRPHSVYEEMPNPCAYGSSATLVQCSVPTSSACSGQQFCHVGPSREATVCCEKPTIIDPCNQPLNVGVGNSDLVRFYYDPTNQQCQSYSYRGYQGNENNFVTLHECQTICQVNPCARGEPFRSSMGILYCSAMSVCPNGFYCHIGASTRTSVCCPVLGSDPCAQPLETGFSTVVAPNGVAENSAASENVLLRWYYDVTQRKCLSFVYAGQKGTQNNFLSKEDCDAFCHPEPLDPCRLPAQRPLISCVPGSPDECGNRADVWCHIGFVAQTTVCCPVEAADRCAQPVEIGLEDRAAAGTPSQRWYFDARSGRCETFIYNGLKGNQNNFVTREECEASCAPNPCPTGKPLLTLDSRAQTCSMSSTLSTCPADYWCHVGPDTSTTVCCPNANMNPCRLPMSVGHGSANLERYYYDQAAKTCRSFRYGGFAGNQNNFLTMRSCQLSCQPLDNPCVGQPAKSPNGQPIFCSAANRDSCPVNFWCHLGANPETTICCPGATNQCSVPLAPGTGNAGLARWYYNADDRACVAFQYNGKRGNQNNFLSQAECQRTCPEQLCLLSIDRGSCSGQQTRYAFDRHLGECVPFEYSGCGGNLNNFLSMSDCIATCGDVEF